MPNLRRVLAAGALALVVAAPASAQSTRLGLKVGLTSSTITGDDAEGAESLNGFSGGAFATFQLSPAFAIQPEILYMSKGASVDFEDDFTADLKLRYIEVPLLAKYSFGTGPLRPAVFAGPALAFRTGCEIEIESGSGAGQSFDCEDDDVDLTAFKSTDFGGILGVGFDYDLGGAALVLDARLGLGLTSIDNTDSDADAKNRAWSFLVGASFPVGGR